MMSSIKFVLGNYRFKVRRDFDEIIRLVVGADREERLIFFDRLFSSAQCRQFAAFDIHFDKRSGASAKNFIDSAYFESGFFY